MTRDRTVGRRRGGRRSGALGRLAAFLAVSLAACATAPPAPVPSRPADLDDVRRALWHGETEVALDRLDRLAWERVGSVSGERLRQDLRLARGERGAVLRELAALQRAHPDHPDLEYLRVRIVEDPVRRLDRLQELARRWPEHAWIRLGAAGTAQSLGKWSLARRHLLAAPRWRDAEDFRTVLAARQAERDAGPGPAFRLLHGPAFRRGLQPALFTYLQVADRAGDRTRVERARAELALRGAQAGELSEGERMDLVFTRAEAEWPWLSGRPLDEVLGALDRWARLAGVPAGWSEQPRFRVGGLAQLVMPEPTRGEASRAWVEQGRFLLAGSAWGRGSELHLLRGLRLAEVPWPGARTPVLLVFADEARSPSTRTPQGGTVFHGFYVRADQVRAAAERIRVRQERFAVDEGPSANWLAQAGPLESWDLPERLRRARLAHADGDPFAAIELTQVALHEAGHLPDVLPWVAEGPPLLRLLPAAVASWTRLGDPLLWLEYRAQLRALAAGVETRWVLAEVVARAHQPDDAYFRPYRALLADLVERARAEGWPHLALWDTRRPEEIAALARGLLDARGLAPIPPEGWSAIAEAIEALDVFEQAPTHGPSADEIHGGEIDAQ